MRGHGFSEEDWERADYWHDGKADRLAKQIERSSRMGQQTIEKRATAVASLAKIAQRETSTLDTWEAVTLMLFISHLQGEANHWLEMYNREALRLASTRAEMVIEEAIDEMGFD